MNKALEDYVGQIKELKEENKQLKEENKRLRRQIEQLVDEKDGLTNKTKDSIKQLISSGGININVKKG